MRMRYRCYAKVNLTLEVLGKRGDGYHDLASLVHTVDLADELSVEPADRLQSVLEQTSEIDPEANLVARAAARLASETGGPRGARLSLVKRIPVAAGLGGGSTDAAATLVALNRLWRVRLGLGALRGLAAELGSDIPFFLRGGAALMRGRGDEVQALPALKGQWLVLAVPRHAFADKTRRLYAALETGDFSSAERTLRAAQRVQRGQALDEADLVNAFERAARAVFPGLSEVWAAAEQVCGRRFFLSGAGPALFGLARDRADAHQQRSKLAELKVAAYAVRTVAHARRSISFAGDRPIEYP